MALLRGGTRLLVAMALSLSLFASTSFAVDVILEWNAVALEANVLDHNGLDIPANTLSETQGPPASARVLAIVHGAMFDAWNSINGDYQPYLGSVAAAPGASDDAAVARACRDILVALIPSETATWDARLATTLARVTDAQAQADGEAVGAAVAANLLAARAGDSAFLGGTYTPTGAPGNHDVDPFNPAQNFLSPEIGSMPPFGIASVAPYRAPAPAALSSFTYARSLWRTDFLGNFRGGSTGATVPASDETYVIANYWSYNGSPQTGTPPRIYNQIARQIAMSMGNSESENARLFTLINISLGDSGVSAWDSKYTYDFWRPVLGIQQANTDGNFLTWADPNWQPLGGSRSNPFPGEQNFSPPFPAYTSGHATFGATVMKTLANFYQTNDISFKFVSDEWNGVTLDQFNRVRPLVPRSFPTLSWAAAENAASRVFNGVHWDFDGTEGVIAGNGIADENFNNLIRPVVDNGETAIPNVNVEREINRIIRRGTIQRIFQLIFGTP